MFTKKQKLPDPDTSLQACLTVHTVLVYKDTAPDIPFPIGQANRLNVTIF